MKNKTILSWFALFISLFSFSQDECRGLSFHSVYTFNHLASFTDHFGTSDSSSIFLGGIDPKAGLISKIKKNGLIAWNKQYFTKDFSVSLVAGQELREKKYIAVGFLIDPDLFSAIPRRILIVKYDTAGQILWNQVLTVHVPKGNLDQLSDLDIREDLIGNIIVVARVSSRAVFSGYNFSLIAYLDKNGALLWNKFIESPFGIILKIPDQTNREIEILGNYSYLNSANRTLHSFLYLKVAPDNGKILYSNGCSFLFSQAEGTTWTFFAGMRARKKGSNSFAIYGTVPDNGGSALQGLVLTYSNNSFSSCYRINSTIANSNLYKKYVCVDTSGNAGFLIAGGKGNARMYYAAIDVSGKVYSQKTASTLLSDIWQTNTIEENLLAFKGGVFSFAFPLTVNSNTLIHHFQLDQNEIDAAATSCISTDTTGVINTENIVITPDINPWVGEYTNAVSTNAINITIGEVPLYKEEICFSKAPPKHPLSLGNDLLLCPNDSAVLQTSYAYGKYEWQDGSTNSVYIVSAPGIYSLKVQDHCDYLYTDTVNIKYSNSRLNMGKDWNVCSGDKVLVERPVNFTDFVWQPSIDVKKINGYFQLAPKITTEYRVEAKDTAGCFFADSIMVQVNNCVNKIFIPSAFTPNSDGKNDVFKPDVRGRISFYRFTIFNRWGAPIFRTSDINKGWDGNLDGQPQKTSTFIWICEYQFKDEVKQIMKGSLLLIR